MENAIRMALITLLALSICPSPSSLPPHLQKYPHKRETVRESGKERRRRKGKKIVGYREDIPQLSLREEIKVIKSTNKPPATKS